MINKIMPFRSLRRISIFLCICLIVVIGIQCGKSIGDKANSRGSTVVVAVGSVNAVLPDQTGAELLTFLPLAERDENGELEGRLAESWEHSPDYREWIYHLRTDVLWHDGAPVTAHDLKFTIDLLTHPDVLAGYNLSATALNDSTLKIESSQVHDYQDDILYYPKHLLEHLDPKDFWDWEFWKRPVGNGPYRFVRYEPEIMIEFEANPNYYRGKPSIERVILKFVGKTGGLTELLSGNGDAVRTPPPAHIHHLVTDPRFRVYHEHGAAGIGILWQHTNPRFRDPRVRRALTLAINRRELLPFLNLPENLPLIDGPITARQMYRRQLPEPIEYNPAQARVLLDAAGWHNQDGDEIRKREGQEFRFTALAFAIGSSQTTDKSAVYIQAQLRQVGVQMDIQVLDKSVVMDRIRIGEFDAAFMIVSSNPRWFLRHFGADSPLGYNNPEVINLFDQAVVTADPSAQDRIYRELMRIFRVEQPITYVRLFCNTYVVHQRIQGLSSPFRADLTRYMDELWIEEEKK